jgi:hypothetical protein
MRQPDTWNSHWRNVTSQKLWQTSSTELLEDGSQLQHNNVTMRDERFSQTKAALQTRQTSQDRHYRWWRAGTTARARSQPRGAIWSVIRRADCIIWHWPRKSEERLLFSQPFLTSLVLYVRSTSHRRYCVELVKSLLNSPSSTSSSRCHPLQPSTVSFPIAFVSLYDVTRVRQQLWSKFYKTVLHEC